MTLGDIIIANIHERSISLFFICYQQIKLV